MMRTGEGAGGGEVPSLAREADETFSVGQYVRSHGGRGGGGRRRENKSFVLQPERRGRLG